MFLSRFYTFLYICLSSPIVNYAVKRWLQGERIAMSPLALSIRLDDKPHRQPEAQTII
jgi:hypothetical protein